jgi:hypothetical protein
MDQAVLYDAIAQAGYTVLEFSDHPGSFGSWYVTVKRKGSVFRISEDGRDSCLTLSRQKPTNEWELLREANSGTLDELKTIAVCAEWLASAKG